MEVVEKGRTPLVSVTSRSAAGGLLHVEKFSARCPVLSSATTKSTPVWGTLTWTVRNAIEESKIYYGPADMVLGSKDVFPQVDHCLQFTVRDTAPRLQHTDTSDLNSGLLAMCMPPVLSVGNTGWQPT